MKQKSTGRGYRRIYRRVLGTLLLLAVTPLAALGWFSLSQINDIYDQKTAAGIEALTSSKLRALDTFIEERVGQIRNLAFTHSYEELSDPVQLSRLFSVLQSNGRSFVDLGILNLEGRHVSYVGPYSLMDYDYQDAEWFLQVRDRGTYVSNTFLGKRKVPHFIIAVLRHEGARSFIMRATIDTGAITDLLQRAYSGSHSDAFLISDEGVLQTDSLYYGRSMEKPAFDLSGLRKGAMALRHLRPARILPEAEAEEAQPGQVTATAQNALPGQRPAEVLAVLAPMDTMPWILVVADDVHESLVPLRRLRVFIICFVLVGCMLVAVGAVVSTRRLVLSIMEKDRRQADIDSRLLQSSKMVALGKMAAGVAHEVNNPLMLIQENAGWITDLLSDEKPQNIKNYDEIMTSCEKIAHNVQRARGITQRMLGFGRRVNPGRAEVMMNVVADHVVELLQSEARSHNVTFERHYSHDVPVILSDPSQLEQVVLNIIDNAIDAIGKDGVITLDTRPTPFGGVRLSIADSGPGLAPEVKAHIFDPFFTTKAVGEGTGLGLAICYSILEKLGGSIEVESEPGQGTTFTIVMPPEPPDPHVAA